MYDQIDLLIQEIPGFYKKPLHEQTELLIFVGRYLLKKPSFSVAELRTWMDFLGVEHPALLGAYLLESSAYEPERQKLKTDSAFKEWHSREKFEWVADRPRIQSVKTMELSVAAQGDALRLLTGLGMDRDPRLCQIAARQIQRSKKERSVKPSSSKVVAKASGPANALKEFAENLTDGLIKSYYLEAIDCFNAGCNRAAVVMMWCAVYEQTRQELMADARFTKGSELGRLLRRPPRAVSDLDEISESEVLKAARNSNSLSLNRYRALLALLHERNAYAHPSGRSISKLQCEAFFERVLKDISR